MVLIILLKLYIADVSRTNKAQASKHSILKTLFHSHQKQTWLSYTQVFHAGYFVPWIKVKSQSLSTRVQVSHSWFSIQLRWAS
jgi:hypothetical protein